MDEEVLKALAEINSTLSSLRAEIQKLVSALSRAEAEKTAATTATSFQKRS